ncbi:hypothetical protein Y032_0424g1222 [Ancylostoma ceylanicum]|nr:hypothetical protein Y032_0424g1222 [Ancylostoma ceylanicum]
MEAAHTNADWAFLNRKPFGFMMSGQTVVSLFIVLLVAFAPFVFEGVAFVSGCALTLFLCSLLYNLFHVMGWNRKVLQLPGGINLFVPCTLWVFGCSVIFFFLFLFGTLICLVGFFDSFRFTVRLIITYFFLSLATALNAFICLRLGVLLFRAAPNSQLLALTTVVIDGDKTSRMEGSAPQFSPATTPGGGTNPV